MFQTLRRGRSLHRPGTMRRFYGNLRRIRWCPWVDVGIDPYANLGTFRIAAQNRRTHAYYTHVFHKCHVKSVEAKDPAMAAAGRAGASDFAKNRAPAGSQSAGARFLWQNLRRGSVSGLNCRRKERHLLQSPPSPIKTANTNKKSAQPNPLAARIHSLPLREIHVRPRFRRRYGTALSRPDLAQRASQ